MGKLCSGLLVCVLLCSCVSSRRMGRISPFSSAARGGMPDPDRVNVWPLVYHSGDATSVLWPILDWDSDGFAVRPVVARDGSDWSVAFPLAGWDTSDKTGWVATAYRSDDDTGLFPLFNIGDDFCYVGPVWWKPYGDGRGVFPLWDVWDDFRHVGPAWWTPDGDARGLFPLWAWAEELRHIGPAWWVPDEGIRGLFPICAWGEGWGGYIVPVYWGSEERMGGLFPIYHTDVGRGGGRRHKILFGILASFSRKTNGDYRQHVTPCWYARKQGEKQTHVLFPVFYHREEKNMRMLLTPLGGRGWDSSGETRVANVLGPLYHQHGKGDKSYRAFLWPVFTMSGKSTWRLWPLVAYNGKRGRKSALQYLTAVRITDTADCRGVSVLGPFGFTRHTRQRRGGPDCRMVALLGLFTSRESPARARWQVLLGAVGGKREGDRSRLRLLLYSRDRKGDTVRRDFFPFVTWDSEPDRSRFSFLWRVYQHEREGERRSGHIFFVPWGK